MNNKPNISGEFLIALATVLWSFSAILSRLAHVSPVLLNALRCAVAFVFTAIVSRSKIKINRVVLLGALCFVATNTFYFIALQNTSAANAVVLQYSAPIFVLVETCIFYRRRPAFVEILVLISAFCGILLVFGNGLGGGTLIGNVCALLAGISFSGVFFVNKMENSSTIDSTKIGYLICAVAGLFFVNEIPSITTTSWLVVVAMGVFQIGLAYVFFSNGLKSCSGFNASIIGTFEIVLVPLWVGLFLHEVPSPLTFVGGSFIIFAIVINIFYSRSKSKKL